MAEIPKTPKDLQINKLRRPATSDDYEDYMRAVLRQAMAHPDVAPSKRTH